MADSDKNKPSVTDACTVCTGRKVLIGSAVAFLLLATTLSMCMVVVFIHNSQLLNRMEELEAMVSSCNCQSQQQEETIRDTLLQSMLKLPSMNKRGIPKPVLTGKTHFNNNGSQKLDEEYVREDKKAQNEHRGIPTSDIALLYGDVEGVYNAINDSGLPPVLRFNESSIKNVQCNKLMVNGKRDILCIPDYPKTEPVKYMIRSDNPMYQYFTEAPWMDAESFETSADGNLIVKKPGLYIVTSSMQFTEGSSGMIHYGVFVRDSSNAINSERVLGLCAASVTTGSQRGSIFPCSTWQLAPLNAGDQVFMRINPYAWFMVQKETFFLAAIKLQGVIP